MMSTNSPAFMKVSVGAHKLKKYSDQMKQGHCSAWQKSGLSMNEYCRRTGLAISSLSKWNQEARYSESSALCDPPDVVDRCKQSVEVVLSNGTCVRFPEISNIAEMIKLIQGLSACN